MQIPIIKHPQELYSTNIPPTDHQSSLSSDHMTKWTTHAALCHIIINVVSIIYSIEIYFIIVSHVILLILIYLLLFVFFYKYNGGSDAFLLTDTQCRSPFIATDNRDGIAGAFTTYAAL